MTNDNFDELLESAEETVVSPAGTVAAGTGVFVAVALWPFVAAFSRGSISRERLNQACVRLAGSAGTRLCLRLVALAALGPIVLWYLLARGVMGATELAGIHYDKQEQGARS